MFGMGMGEIVLIAVVALLVLGPERLPGAAKAIGKGIRDLRASTKDLQSTIEKDTQIGDAVRELRGALRGDPETLYKRATGEDFNAPEGKGDAAKDEASDTSVKTDNPSAKTDNPSDTSAKTDNPSDTSAKTGDSTEADADPAGNLIDAAYANTDDAWGAAPSNPHTDDADDSDVPLIKPAAHSVPRAEEPLADSGDGKGSDESDHG